MQTTKTGETAQIWVFVWHAQEHLSEDLFKEEYFVRILGNVFLFPHKNMCCGYSLGAPQRGASNEYPQHNCMNCMKNWEKNIQELAPDTPP